MSCMFLPGMLKPNLLTNLFRDCVNTNKYSLSSAQLFTSKVRQMVPTDIRNLTKILKNNNWQ